MSDVLAPTEILALAKILDELDYYQILHVRADAPASEVRKAFHASSRAFHPDANRHLDAEHRTAIANISKRISEAYTVLRDPMRRKAYDESLRGGRRRLQISEADAAAEQQATAELEAPKGREQKANIKFVGKEGVRPALGSIQAGMLPSVEMPATEKEQRAGWYAENPHFIVAHMPGYKLIKTLTPTATASPAAEETEAPVEASDTAAAPASFVFDRPIQTVGRRKEAVVRVRLVPGTGKFNLNGRTLEGYFPNKVHQQLIKAPLVTVDRVESFDIYALLHGGGPSGQAGALRLGIARALIVAQPEDRPPLKKAGFLTRDPRATERKKYGLKKARKAPQYSKR